MVKLQYHSQTSAHYLSLILMGSGSLLKVQSAFHPSNVSKTSTQLGGGAAKCSILNYVVNFQENALRYYGVVYELKQQHLRRFRGQPYH